MMSVLVRESAAAAEDLASAIAAFTGGAPLKTGKVKLDIATLVDNGNTVPLAVSVESQMTPADYVKTVAIFNERNPQRDVAIFNSTPASGRASASTRIRLATSQKLTAIARMSDGSYWQHTVDVIVTLAACIEGDGNGG